jgi:initiation factor 1A
MPKCKSKKNVKPEVQQETNGSIIEKDDSSEYAVVTHNLGSHFKVKLLTTGEEVVARLPGKFKYKKAKKMNFIVAGSFVLVGMRDFQDNMVDIIYVYNIQDVRKLRKQGVLIEEGVGEKCNTSNLEEECVFDFAEI